MTIDLPDALLRRLSSRAAVERITLEQLVRTLIARGLQVPSGPWKYPGGRSRLPSLSIGHPLRLRTLSNASLADLANE